MYIFYAVLRCHGYIPAEDNENYAPFAKCIQTNK